MSLLVAGQRPLNHRAPVWCRPRCHTTYGVDCTRGDSHRTVKKSGGAAVPENSGTLMAAPLTLSSILVVFWFEELCCICFILCSLSFKGGPRCLITWYTWGFNLGLPLCSVA
jgi:hypothetical protein